MPYLLHMYQNIRIHVKTTTQYSTVLRKKFYLTLSSIVFFFNFISYNLNTELLYMKHTFKYILMTCVILNLKMYLYIKIWIDFL